MSLSKENKKPGATDKAIAYYVDLLKRRPLVTKSVTSGVVAGIGNIISQAGARKVNWRNVGSYATAGVIFVGPLMHYFYIWLDNVIPKSSKNATLKRVFLDRFVFAPPFLLVYFWLLSILEGEGHSGAMLKIKETFWPILKTNWKVWTVFQYVNINFVPQQFRVLFASLLALFWNIYVASTRK